MQDAQEFSKLFMALLETDPAMCQFIQQQFMGKYEYLTWSVLLLVASLVGFLASRLLIEEYSMAVSFPTVLQSLRKPDKSEMICSPAVIVVHLHCTVD